MKRIILLILVIMQFMVYTACGSGTAAQKPNSEEVIVNESTMNVPGDNTDARAKGKGAEEAAGSSSFEIIAESGNSISSVDKEKVIKKLDDELSTLFDNINSLEDK